MGLDTLPHNRRRRPVAELAVIEAIAAVARTALAARTVDGESVPAAPRQAVVAWQPLLLPHTETSVLEGTATSHERQSGAVPRLLVGPPPAVVAHGRPVTLGVLRLRPIARLLIVVRLRPSLAL